MKRVIFGPGFDSRRLHHETSVFPGSRSFVGSCCAPVVQGLSSLGDGAQIVRAGPPHRGTDGPPHDEVARALRLVRVTPGGSGDAFTIRGMVN